MNELECCTKYADAVFVFGSNEAGRHGKGAALHALTHHHAEHGNGYGAQHWRAYYQPGPRSFAIPTKDGWLRPLPLGLIEELARGFVAHAASLPDTVFYVTRVGCGLAGYKDEQIAPMFAAAPPNCILPVGSGFRGHDRTRRDRPHVRPEIAG